MMRKLLVLTAVLALTTPTVGCHSWNGCKRGALFQPWTSNAIYDDPCTTGTTAVPGCDTCTEGAVPGTTTPPILPGPG